MSDLEKLSNLAVLVRTAAKNLQSPLDFSLTIMPDFSLEIGKRVYYKLPKELSESSKDFSGEQKSDEYLKHQEDSRAQECKKLQDASVTSVFSDCLKKLDKFYTLLTSDKDKAFLAQTARLRVVLIKKPSEVAAHVALKGYNPGNSQSLWASSLRRRWNKINYRTRESSSERIDPTKLLRTNNALFYMGLNAEGSESKSIKTLVHTLFKAGAEDESLDLAGVDSYVSHTNSNNLAVSFSYDYVVITDKTKKRENLEHWLEILNKHYVCDENGDYVHKSGETPLALLSEGTDPVVQENPFGYINNFGNSSDNKKSEAAERVRPPSLSFKIESDADAGKVQYAMELFDRMNNPSYDV